MADAPIAGGDLQRVRQLNSLVGGPTPGDRDGVCLSALLQEPLLALGDHRLALRLARRLPGGKWREVAAYTEESS